MPNIVLTLGPVIMSGFEVPSQINIGGKQRLAVHRLTDGTRVIDSLGRDDSEISFRGIMSGPDATMRARILDVLRVAGEPVSLAWDVFFYTVILSTFAAVYERPSWIPYNITCTVLRDEASSIVPIAMSLAKSVLADVATAASDSSGCQIDVSGVQTALTLPGATTRDTRAFAAAQASISSSMAAVQGQIVSAEGTLQTSTAVRDPSAAAALASFDTASQSAQQLAALTVTNAYLGRSAVNLNNAST